MTAIDLLGMTAGCISSITFLPQVVKTWKTKSAADISLLMFTFATISVIMWLVYGIILQNIPIIFTNSTVLFFSLVMLYFKFKYGRKKRLKCGTYKNRLRMSFNTIIFDLGNVLVRWNPANLYRKIFTNPKELDYFLHEVCTMEWHTLQDGGRSPKEGTELLVKEHPELERPIRAFYDRWKEMFDGPIDGSVQILKELKEKGYPVYALSNWNKELYDQTVNDFPFLDWFDGKIISSEARMKKPDENIYRLLFERYRINPAEAIFIDDNPDNITTAKRLGLKGILFSSPEALRNTLQTLQIL